MKTQLQIAISLQILEIRPSGAHPAQFQPDGRCVMSKYVRALKLALALVPLGGLPAATRDATAAGLQLHHHAPPGETNLRSTEAPEGRGWQRPEQN
jgi:hypothetical protein